MRALRVVGITGEARTSPSSSRTPAAGSASPLPADEQLRAAARGDLTRLGQIAIELESQLRPREIQARIRAGASVEQVAAAAGVPRSRRSSASPTRCCWSAPAPRSSRSGPTRSAPTARTPRMLGDVVAHTFGLRGQEYADGRLGLVEGRGRQVGRGAVLAGRPLGQPRALDVPARGARRHRHRRSTSTPATWSRACRRARCAPSARSSTSRGRRSRRRPGPPEELRAAASDSTARGARGMRADTASRTPAGRRAGPSSAATPRATRPRPGEPRASRPAPTAAAHRDRRQRRPRHRVSRLPSPPRRRASTPPVEPEPADRGRAPAPRPADGAPGRASRSCRPGTRSCWACAASADPARPAIRRDHRHPQPSRPSSSTTHAATSARGRADAGQRQNGCAAAGRATGPARARRAGSPGSTATRTRPAKARLSTTSPTVTRTARTRRPARPVAHGRRARRASGGAAEPAERSSTDGLDRPGRRVDELDRPPQHVGHPRGELTAAPADAARAPPGRPSGRPTAASAAHSRSAWLQLRRQRRILGLPIPEHYSPPTMARPTVPSRSAYGALTGRPT